ncbi:MAG TPA: molybdenum cofactor cytidylyltransferase [Tissierellaceae bacterium]|nr:molybdenum cofactor cytidylyltransferase [Tissierellaceae bacterium]
MTSGIIMASGFSRRMGKDKLLLEIEGKKIVEYVIEAAKKSNLNEIILVYRTREIRDIGEKYNIKTVYNPKAHLGQSQSVILGVENSSSNNSYMFLVGDQPFTDYKLINKLIRKHIENEGKIVIPFSNGNINMPIIFPKLFKEDLLNVKGDKGGREIIQDNPDSIVSVNIENQKLLKDIDTIEEYSDWCLYNIK